MHTSAFQFGVVPVQKTNKLLTNVLTSVPATTENARDPVSFSKRNDVSSKFWI